LEAVKSWGRATRHGLHPVDAARQYRRGSGARRLAGAGLALLGLLLSVPGASGKAECALTAAPKVSLTPLRFVRVKVVSEVDPRNRGGNLELFGPEGFVTSTWVNVDGERGPRTAWVEWRSLAEGPGDYEVRFELRRQGGPACVATDRLRVGGPDGEAR
jgi:hypothetical protein